MQIILREDIPSLGKAGEVVKVADGYGRNFLLPRKKAVIATEGNIKQLEKEKEVIEAKSEALMQASHKLAEHMYAEKGAAEGAAGAEHAHAEPGKKGDDGNVVDAEFTEVKDK